MKFFNQAKRLQCAICGKNIEEKEMKVYGDDVYARARIWIILNKSSGTPDAMTGHRY